MYAILALSLFMRFYYVQNAVFGFDQNRDMIAMRKMALEKRPATLGPKEDRERVKFFFGPYHYYYFFPSYLIARGDPIGPLVFAAMGGVALTYLLYVAGTSFFNRLTGLTAASIHAGSFFFSDWERQFTNPYHVPLLGLGILLLLERSIRSHPYWVILAGLLFGFGLQTHLATLFLGPMFLLYLYPLVRSRAEYRKRVVGCVGAAAAFLLTLVPLLVFDIRHDFLNWKLFTDAITKRSFTGLTIAENLPVVFDYMLTAVSRFFTWKSTPLLMTSLAVIVPLSLVICVLHRQVKSIVGLAMILILPLVYLFGYAITAGNIQVALAFTEISVHQFYMPGFAILLILCYAATLLFRMRAVRAIALLGLVIFLGHNLSYRVTFDNPLGYNHKRDAVNYIVASGQGKPYAVSVIDSVAYGFVDGFEYLFLLRGSQLQSGYRSPTYTITIPAKHDASVRFGDIGVTIPQESEYNT